MQGMRIQVGFVGVFEYWEYLFKGTPGVGPLVLWIEGPLASDEPVTGALGAKGCGKKGLGSVNWKGDCESIGGVTWAIAEGDGGKPGVGDDGVVGRL